MNDARVYERSSLIALMRMHANGKYQSTKCAPKRPTLKIFGGALTIDEFRKNSSNVIVTMPWETHLIPTVTTARTKPHLLPQTVSNDSLVLRRAKPLARTKSSLESSLGITRKTK